MIRKLIAAVSAAFFICLLAGCAEPTEAATDRSESAAPVEETVQEETAAVPETTAAPVLVQEAVTTEEMTEETTEEPTPSPKIGQTALAMVPNYVNVRKGPTTEDEVVGKIYNFCAADILDEVEGEDGNWYLIVSGNVTGYIKAVFFVTGDDAESMRNEVGILKGTVMEDYLRVRSEPDLNNPDNVFTYYERGTEVIIEEVTEDGWAKIKSDDASTGFVYAECLDIRRVFKTAVTLEEEAEEIARREAAEEAARIAQEEYEAALAAQEEARRAAEQALAEQQAAEAAYQAQIAAQQQAEAAQQAAAEEAARLAAERAAQQQAEQEAATTDALMAQRNAVVAFALQFVGNPYVHGGRSLVTGTDCSGFTSLVYQNFGYYLDYTPAGQANQGVRVDLGSILPGDLLFYSNSQKYLGHVAMYIGNGQIVHSGTVETGVIVSSAYYRNPLFAVRVIN